MKKLILLMVTILFISTLTGCSHGATSSAIAASVSAAKTAVGATSAVKSSTPVSTASTVDRGLRSEDFSVVYHNTIISLDADAESIVDKIGSGTGKVNLIGMSKDDKYKYYSHVYDGLMIFDIEDVQTGKTIISEIVLNSKDEINAFTNRNVMPGASYDKMINEYGEAYSKRVTSAFTTYEYSYNDDYRIIFYVVKDMITQIIMGKGQIRSN